MRRSLVSRSIRVRPGVRRAGAVALVAMIFLVLGAGSAFAASSATTATTGVTTTTLPAVKVAHPGVQRVLVISIPTVSWEDLDLSTMPNLSQLFAKSAVADLSVRGVGRVPSLADGYVTIGAGTRSVGHPTDDGECLEPNEPFGTGTARQEMARRNGVSPSAIPSSSIVCLAQHEIASRNGGLLFNAKVSALGDTLEAAGIQRAVIGNGDPTLRPTDSTDYRRWVGLALTDQNGLVPAGDVGSSLLERDPTAPFGLKLDTQRVLAAFDHTWNESSPKRSVVFVEDSDLIRLQLYAAVLTPTARAEMQQRVLAGLDSLVGDLMKQVDPAHDAVMVVAPSQRGGAGRLTVASLYAPGVKPGLAVSSWTRHSGVVSIVDIGPTILDQLGIEPPAQMEGRPIEFGRTGGDPDARVNWLVDANKGAQFRDREISQVTVWFVVLQIVLTALALVAFVRFGRRAQVAIELAALTLLGFLAATFLAGLLPFYRLGSGPYWLFLFGVGFAIALISWLTTDRSGVTTLIVALSVLVGLIIVDVASGARLQFNTVFGYSPTVAGRFAGLGNLGYAQLASGAVLLAGLLAYRIGGRRGAYVAIALLAVAIIVDGAPFFGSDVGGVLSMVPAYAVTATLLLGWKVRWKLIALYGLATVGLLAIFAAIDMTRPVSKRTHLGRLVASGEGQGGFHSVSTLIHRKLSENTGVLFSSIWTIMLPVVLAGIAYLIYRAPGRMRGLHERIPQLSAALVGLLIVGVLGTALNDSGIAIAGVMLGVMTPVLVVVTMRGDRARPRWAISPTADPDPPDPDPPDPADVPDAGAPPGLEPSLT
jgi:hypothetical protein